MRRLWWTLCVILLVCGVAVAQDMPPPETPPSVLGLHADTSSPRGHGAPAFTRSRHEALDLSEYKLATFTPQGILMPSRQ
jgi:hypothetical protein